MNLFFKNCTKILSLIITIICLTSFFSFAEGENYVNSPALFSLNGLICVYKTDSVDEQTLQYAAKNGADFIYLKAVLKDDKILLENCKAELEALLDTYDTVNFLIETDSTARDEIYNLIIEKNAFYHTALLLSGKTKDSASWMKTLGASENSPVIITAYRGNVIFNSSAAIKKSKNAGACGIMLASSNIYSTSFMKSEVKSCNPLNAVIDMTEPKNCGKRTDTAAFWDDVASRGFSVIITSDLEGFNLYKQRTELSREKLESLVNKVKDRKTDKAYSSADRSFNRALENAENSLKYEFGAGAFDEKYEALLQANEQKEKSSEGIKGTLTVSAPRIIAAVCVVIGFIAVEYGFEYFKKKKEEERNAQKNKAN